jgi:predicted ATPase/DNA-binding CsgD family transcriptional regulator/class 3 adenylate cyclase
MVTAESVDGPVTLLSTGVERSVLLWEMAPNTAVAALARHYELIDAALAEHGAVRSGRTVDGDGVLAEFRTSYQAVAAALAVQRAFAAEEWPDGLPIRVRIGLYTTEVRDPDRTGGALQRCTRLRDIAHGGQTLLSAATASLAADALPDRAWLADLGEHRLRDLSRPEHLYELRHPDLAHDFPQLRSLDMLPNNLPPQLTSFVGREDELADVKGLLAAQRLITLTGAGGCGKTRLALQLAAEVADRWPDGVWWIDLGPIADPALVAELAASTMRVLVEPIGGPLRAMASQLRRRRLLICLDTCEHVLDAVAELTETLLRSCPDVAVLATSREPLGVAGETVWRVPSLREAEAVGLFAERAALVRPDFRVEAGDDTVRTICRRLDGIPLAIELAAAWVPVLSPGQIATGIHDLFRLAGGPRGVTDRHRTLAASVQWSHDLLDADDRVVFRRLAVFAGGFTLEAVRGVCADESGPAGADGAPSPAGLDDPSGRAGLDDPSGPAGPDVILGVLRRLVDKSLVVMVEGDAAKGGEVRYRLLDTIRRYAMDRLEEAGETGAVRDRHLGYFLSFTQTAESTLEADQDSWRARLAAEHDNFRAALDWGLAAEDPERGRSLAAALAQGWFLHGHTSEGLAYLNRAIERSPADRSTVQASLLTGLALVALGGGRPTLTADVAARALEIAIANDDDRNRARCLVLSSYLPIFTDFVKCRDLAREARRYAAAADDRFALDLARVMESNVNSALDRHEEAVALAREFVEPCLARGERFAAAFGLSCETWAALFGGDLRRADELGTEVLRIAEPLGDYFTIGLTTYNLAWVKGLRGEIDAGRRLMEPIVTSIEHAGPDVELLPWLSLGPGKLHLWSGDYAGAVRWFERATQFAAPMTDNWVAVRALPGLASALRRLGRLDEARTHAERGIALGKKLDCPHALAEALEQAAFLAEPDEAEDLHHQALAVRVEHGLRTFYVDSLEAIAGLAARAGDHEAAVRLIAACEAAREPIGYPRPAIDQPDHDATTAAVRAALGDAAFDEAWSHGRSLSLDDAVAYATRGRGARGRPSTGWASLTPVEKDVVRLVAAGLTNAQIGARLFISRATVKTHLVHVYAKLGINSRTELATRAAARSPDITAGESG